jgi:release factor glutamine methyltransferase
LTLGEVLRATTDYLAGRGVPSSRVDAEHLLGHALGLTRVELYMHLDRPLTESELAEARALVGRRGRREPLAYVLGEWGFRRLVLKVDRRALVPRPETEVVVERCLELLRELERPRVLDVGTGTGAIALALADEHPGLEVTATDTSEEALALARENAAGTGLGSRVRFELRDALAGLGPDQYDLVVSNPPYVRPDELEGLEPEVRDWEPRAALIENGTTEAIAAGAREALAAGGWLVLETGEAGAQALAERLRALGYDGARITPDLTGRERVVEGRWAPTKR